MAHDFDLPKIVQTKVRALGAEGQTWLNELPELIESLADKWSFVPKRSLDGGSEALVLQVQRADGGKAILKLAIPGAEIGTNELAVLSLADGKGYAQIFAHDLSRRAVLMEALGARLESLNWSIDDQMHAICDTLKRAWIVLEDPKDFHTGEQKAQDLGTFIEDLQESEGRPCSPRVISRVLSFAAARRDAFDPARAIIAHGDCHSANTLVSADGPPMQFKFVDPDGLFIDREYDLGILMRDWNELLLGGNTLDLTVQRCRNLAALTGADPKRIWQWGEIERVSTGLYLKQLEMPEEADLFLGVAERLATVDVPF